jgi:pilus assembly protein Flp/PilA
MLKYYIKFRATIDSLKDESGQDLIEYALLGALIAVACIAAESSLASAIKAEFGLISGSI